LAGKTNMTATVYSFTPECMADYCALHVWLNAHFTTSFSLWWPVVPCTWWFFLRTTAATAFSAS